jgi:hypothetical protein
MIEPLLFDQGQMRSLSLHSYGGHTLRFSDGPYE